MHFALPPRKTSHPPPYASRSSGRSPLLRRGRLQNLILMGVVAIGVLWLLISLIGGGRGDGVRMGKGAVVVTVFDANMQESYVNAIKENRKDYASRHGTFHRFFFGVVSTWWE